VKRSLFGFFTVALLALACGEEEGVTPNKDYGLVPT
jgi:hypothetical protein